MAVVASARRPVLDGALPLAVLSAVLMAVPALRGALPWLAAVVLVFAAAMALSTGADRPGEPAWAWRAYGAGAAALAVTVPIGGNVETMPLGLILVGLVIQIAVKARHGAHRVGLLSAFGRRAHDGRVGRTLELMCVALAAAAATHEPVLYVVAGWLLTSAAVAERPSSEPEAQPASGAPAPAA